VIEWSSVPASVPSSAVSVIASSNWVGIATSSWVSPSVYPASVLPTTISLTYVPTLLTPPPASVILPSSIPTSQVTVVIKTQTLYIISSNDVLTTFGTIVVPASFTDHIVSSPSFIPASVSIPSSYIVVPVTAFHCNA